MAVPSSETLNYDAVLSTTLYNYRPTLYDQISTSNALLFFLRRRGGDSWRVLDALGAKAEFELMYELGSADSYSNYDPLNTDPMDGVTSALWDWRQASVPIAISGLEELKNAGEYQKLNLLQTKMKQATLGIEDFFGKRLMYGAGGSSITSAYVSPTNGSTFIDPLPLIVKYDPTTSTSIGNINQSTYSWWANQTVTSTASTFSGFLKELRNLNNLCTKGPGGPPDLWLSDQLSYELYESALAAAHRNPDYDFGDIPFDAVAFKGKPMIWDEFVPDAAGDSATQSASSGTIYALNTQFWGLQVARDRNFMTTDFTKPENQDARLAHILFAGAVGVQNRRKQGVIGAITTTTAS